MRASIEHVSGRLFLVGTPIGNLGDLTDRARETLAAVDVLAAEDTRRTGRLLAHAGIRRPMVSLFEGNERERTRQLLERLRAGEDVALVSDAGMPTISDPGFRLVRACVEEGIDVRVVPGPSAVTAALAVSGLAVDRFAFEGFPPRRVGERRARLRSLAHDPRTVVFFESPQRVVRLLGEVLAELGDRRMALARELTKLHEEVIRGRVSEVLARLEGAEPRGEVVVVLEGHRGEAADPPSLLEEARGLVSQGMRKREAAAAVARRHGASSTSIYEALVRPAEPDPPA
jgi:16S rRNA (cytidine1402-2'-O)-methyltransferase